MLEKARPGPTISDMGAGSVSATLRRRLDGVLHSRLPRWCLAFRITQLSLCNEQPQKYQWQRKIARVC